MSPLGPLGPTYRYTHKVGPCATYVRTYGLTKNPQDSGGYLTFLNAREKSDESAEKLTLTAPATESRTA